jgi:3-deoxy-D-manno-octulosonic-acid transferase
MLGTLDLIACQYADHARRFEALGARTERLFTLGNVKFDLRLPSARAVEELRNALGAGARRIWIAASTHPGEEQTALRAQRSLRARFPDALLLLAPRHPERFDAVARLTDDAGMTFVRLTTGNPCGDCDVLVCDTMGRLGELYGLASVAFVGGSLVPRGGHNPIEAAALGVPVLMGPHDFNFSDVTALLERAGCLHRVEDASSLEQAVAGLFGAPDVRATQSAAARRVVDANRGATERQWEKLVALTGVLRGRRG